MVDWRLTIGGFFVGVLLGMTGMGGGTLMTPMLIFLFHMKPTLAVGTDLVYTAITKLAGSIQHLRQRTVDFPAFRWLALGSVPGALGGSIMVGSMTKHLNMNAVNHSVDIWLGIVYILIIITMVWRWYWSHLRGSKAQPTVPRLPKVPLLVLGLIGGFLVGVTSIGSGAIFIAVMTVIYPITSARMVGTDVVQAAILTAVAGLTHLLYGNVDLSIVLSLIIGSVPGTLIGSRLTTRVPDTAVRVGLMAMMFYTSWSLLTK
jgi:uncharacterized membrane protein YfcA